MNSRQLLSDVRSRGIRLSLHAGRLRVQAPAGVLTSALRASLETHKPELLQLLASESAPTDPITCKGQFRYVGAAMSFGDICAGWTPARWAEELRRKAGRCDEYRPDIATYYRNWAADIEARLSPD